MKLTAEQIAEIYEMYDVDMSEKEFLAMLEQCNEQDGINGRNPEQWAHWFAQQEANEQNADAAEYADYQHQAFGN